MKKDGLWGVVNKKAELVVPYAYKDESLDDFYSDDNNQISNKELKKQVDELSRADKKV